MPNPDRDLTEKARKLAAKAHENSKPYGKLPYITHPAAVAKLLSPYGPNAVAAGWLHDTVEDTDVTLDQLRTEGFPEDVVTAVDGVTRRETNGVKEPYLDFVCRAAATSWLSRITKLADNIHNSSGLDQAEDQIWARGMKKRYRRARQILELAMVTDVSRLDGLTNVGGISVLELDPSEGPNTWIAIGHHDHTAILVACSIAAHGAGHTTLFGDDVPEGFTPDHIRTGSGHAILSGDTKDWNITTVAPDHTGVFRPITADTVGSFAVTWIENP